MSLKRDKAIGSLVSGSIEINDLLDLYMYAMGDRIPMILKAAYGGGDLKSPGIPDAYMYTQDFMVDTYSIKREGNKLEIILYEQYIKLKTQEAN